MLYLTLTSLISAALAQQLWQKSDLLADMFPTSESVSPVTLELDSAQAALFAEKLGYNPPQTSYTFYEARSADHIDGYALFDDQIGQHEPITFAVQLTPEAVVVRQEVVVYREKYGSEVRHPRFREQFAGRTSADPLEPGRDIQIISGATYSSRSMALGVRRAIVLTELLIAEGAEE